MSSEDKSSKTEKPTAQRRKQAREEGNIPRTPDLSAWLTVIIFAVAAPFSVVWLRELFVELTSQWGSLISQPDVTRYGEILRQALFGTLKVVAPFLLATMLVGSAGHIVQGGLKIYGKRFKPQWKKLNPATGIKQMFTKHQVWVLTKTLLKLIVFGFVAYQVAAGALEEMIGGSHWSIAGLAEVTTSASMDLLRIVAGTGLVIAAIDWFMERIRVEGTLKMTKDEIRRESKQSEGDPHVKGHIRAKQREMGRRRMMAAVGEASVVMVNPTHVAVALKYTQGEGAPQVVAKGTGFLAQRIRDEAEAREVPVVRDVIVARTLYKMCEVGQFIPPELYDAIAQILAFIFRLDERDATGTVHDSPLRENRVADDEVPDDLRDAALGIRQSAPAA